MSCRCGTCRRLRGRGEVGLGRCPACKRQVAMRDEGMHTSERIQHTLERAKAVRSVLTKLRWEMDSYERKTDRGSWGTQVRIGPTWGEILSANNENDQPHWTKAENNFGRYNEQFARMPCRYTPSRCVCECSCDKPRSNIGTTQTESKEEIQEESQEQGPEENEEVVETVVEEKRVDTEGSDGTLPPTSDIHIENDQDPLSQSQTRRINNVASVHLSPSGSVDIVLRGGNVQGSDVVGTISKAPPSKPIETQDTLYLRADSNGVSLKASTPSKPTSGFQDAPFSVPTALPKYFTDEQVDQLEEEVFVRHSQLAGLFEN